MARQGRIVVNGDEWTLSDAAYGRASATPRFVQNIANWFTGSQSGTFHAYSNNFALTGRRMAQTMREAGHTWTVGVDIPFTLESLQRYDGVYLAGNAADNNVLIEYVRSGGCVYLAGGTGWGWAVAEARRWKPFLNAFGLKYNERYDGVGGAIPCRVDHPLFEGVDHLYYNNGNDVVDIDPDSAENAVLLKRSGKGLIAVFDLGLGVPNVAITDILFDGKVARSEADEYIELTNAGSGHADISGWKISADDVNQDFVFPAGTMLRVGQVIRVYTNQVHPEFGGYSFGSGRAIWNNKGEVGRLFDAAGKEMSSFGYGEKEAQETESIDAIKAALGVSGLAVNIDPEDIERLAASDSEIKFSDALRQAINSFVSDSNMSESPMWMMNASPSEYGLEDGAGKAAMSAKVRELLNTSGCSLTLFTEAEDSSDEWVGKVMCDETGDSYGTGSYWIFKLERSPFTDSNTAVVDKSGNKPTINWGYS